jgi:glutathione S-transferase
LDQSIAICRFLAKEVGLCGSNDFEDFEIDSVVDTINDFRFSRFCIAICLIRFEICFFLTELQSTLYLKPQEEYEKNLKMHQAETIPFYLSRLEEIAKENHSHFALKRRTWADIYFAAIVEYLRYLTGRNLLDTYPHLTRVVNNIVEIRSIKNWIEIRPITEY